MTLLGSVATGCWSSSWMVVHLDVHTRVNSVYEVVAGSNSKALSVHQ